MSKTQQGRRAQLTILYSGIVCAVVMTIAIRTPAQAQQSLPSELVNADERNSSTGTSLSGRLGLELQQVEGQDDSSSNTNMPVNDTGLLETSLTLGLKHEFTETAELVARLELRARQFFEDSLNNSDDAFSYQLERLYFEQSYMDGNYRWRLGRQGIDDAMNTIVDENLDGLRISIDQGKLEFDGSITQQDAIEASTRERSDKIANLYARVEFKPKRKTVWSPYILFRDQQKFADDFAAKIAWYGLQGLVQPNESWRYWLHLGAQKGKSNNATITRNVGGFLADFGVNYRINHPFKPVISLGYAHASGGSNDTGNRDERYRQSGLHSNNFRLNGKSRFRYLGEVLDPELTNIQILTLGFGAKLNKRWSADVALHTYNQLEIEDEIRGSDLQFEPTELSKDLGTAADFIVAFEPMKNMDLQATFGTFDPGEAFASSQDMAWLGLLELEYDF